GAACAAPHGRRFEIHGFIHTPPELIPVSQGSSTRGLPFLYVFASEQVYKHFPLSNLTEVCTGSKVNMKEL
ncbi:hypothetical protein, partial [Stomatobaculum longum]